MDALRSDFHLSSDCTHENTDAYVLAKNGYVLGAEIGSGSYSTVTRVTRDNLEYACKIVNTAKTTWEYRTRFLPREINIMARLRHPNITRVFQIICEAKKVFIIMELATAGDLLATVQNAGRLDERTTHHIFVQLASALAYLHRRNIAHRDLKCDNILLNAQLVVKLADFSFSRYCNDPVERRKKVLSDTYCGSEAYAAPELLQGVPYYPKQADMWSLGVILYVMMTGALPFPDGNVLQQVRLQMNRVIRFPLYVECTPQYRSLVRLLLEPDTTLRATMRVVARHPWLFLFPDPTNTLTREVQPRATVPELNSLVLVSDWQQLQPSASSVPLPVLHRKAATEHLRDHSADGRTNRGKVGQEPFCPAHRPESNQGHSFEAAGAHRVLSGRRESEEGLLGETTSTTTPSDDGESSADEDPKLPSEQPPVQSKQKPQGRKDQQNKAEVRAFLDSKSTVCHHHEAANQRMRGALNRQGPRVSESCAYPGQLANGAQDQSARQQQPLYAAYYPAETDEAMGLRLPPLGAYEGDRYAEAAPCRDSGFPSVWSLTELDQGIMPPTTRYASPGYGAYERWTPRTPTSSSPNRGY